MVIIFLCHGSKSETAKEYAIRYMNRNPSVTDIKVFTNDSMPSYIGYMRLMNTEYWTQFNFNREKAEGIDTFRIQ
jgi:hypothetical protein